MLTAKDTQKLIKLPNNLLASSHDRVMIQEATQSLCEFYEKNAANINAKVVIVRDKNDEAPAALARNNFEKILFIFSDKYYPTSYFTGVCHNIQLPKVLMSRSEAKD